MLGQTTMVSDILQDKAMIVPDAASAGKVPDETRTIRTPTGLRAARIDGDTAIEMRTARYWCVARPSGLGNARPPAATSGICSTRFGTRQVVPSRQDHLHRF